MVRRREILATGAGAALATLVPALGTAQQAEPAGFYLSGMTGDQQPEGIDTDAQGGALFALDDDASELHYAIAVNNIQDPIMAHIHQGAPGESGPIVVWLHPDTEAREPQRIEGRFDGVLATGVAAEADLVGPLEGESFDALVGAIEDGTAYVNVHTQANQAGEIRGQLLALGDVVDALVEGGEGTPAGTPTGTPTEASDDGGGGVY